jgi:phage terminase large subunit-like protein
LEEKRLGRQLPTQCVVLPYTNTLGGEAVELYNSSGRTAQPWQEQMVYDIMGLDEEEQWVHMKFGWAIPRRNGKSEVAIMICMWALKSGLRVLYTAHRTLTSTSAWEKIVERLAKAGFVEGDDFKTYKTRGCESIEWLSNDGVINFRTRSAKGGLGEGYDVLVIDEAQEYTSDQESALKYTVTDSQAPHGPLTLMCGTPPTAVSSGTVFLNYRNKTLTGRNSDAGWAEWSVRQLSDAHDPELWYEINPSLGSILTERKIRSELGDPEKDKVDDNIQRLGLWLSYSQKSAISRQEWRRLKLESSPVIASPSRLFMGVKFSRGTGNVCLAVSCKLPDGRCFLEAIDCRPAREGNAWMMPFLRNPHVKGIIIDGASGQTILKDEMKDAGIKVKPVLPKVYEVIEAGAMFENAVFAGSLAHMGQPALEQIVTNCDHRAIGSAGGFGYVSILDGAEVALLDAVVLAHWLCCTAKEKKVQRVLI